MHNAPNNQSRNQHQPLVAPPVLAAPTPARASSRYTLISWVLVVVWAGFIFFMSSNSDTGLNEGLGLFSRIFQDLKAFQAQLFGPDADVISSLAHFCEYTVFGALLANALRCHLPLGRACLLAIVCASFYGITDELHQLFVPGRMCDPLDWLVDTFGASLGSGLAFLWFRRRARIRSSVDSATCAAVNFRAPR